MPKPARNQPALPANTRPCLGPVVAFSIMDGTLPQRLKIAKWGVNVARSVEGVGSDKTFTVNEATVAALPVMQSRVGFDLVALDFEHQTHKGSANYLPPPHNVAGHGRIEVVAGDGIYYIASDYTPTGVKHAADYPDLSGVFWPNKNGEVVFVSSVALCQQGSVEGIHFAEAELIALAASISASLADFTAMTPADRVVALCRQYLAFDETATAEDVAAALEAMLRQKSREAEARAQQEALQNKDKNKNPNPNSPSNNTDTMDQETADQIKALTASVKTIADGQATVLKAIDASAKLADASNHNAAVEAVIAASVQAGKVVPASVKAKGDDGKYKMDAASATEIMACIPASVATEFGGGQARAGAGLDAPATVDKEICAALNISEDTWKKGGIPRALEPAPQTGVKVA